MTPLRRAVAFPCGAPGLTRSVDLTLEEVEIIRMALSVAQGESYFTHEDPAHVALAAKFGWAVTTAGVG